MTNTFYNTGHEYLNKNKTHFVLTKIAESIKEFE